MQAFAVLSSDGNRSFIPRHFSMHEIQSHNLKEIAARYAVNTFIEFGMNIGLGTGSTAAYAVAALAERISSEGLVVGSLVATSTETRRLATFHSMLAVRDLDASVGMLDVTIDGADEVDSDLNLIKGGGGALLREKLIAVRTKREVIIVDESKISKRLGTNHSLPVMVIPYAWDTTAERIAQACGATPVLRLTATGTVFVSDDSLYCLDLPIGEIDAPGALEAKLKAITGVVDVGLFVGLARTVVVAKADGQVEVLEKQQSG
jgi:ribose 5-phosphate isomerase A